MGSSLTRLIDAGTDEVYGVRVEPKVFLANERTFLNWLRLSVTLGSIAAVIMTLGRKNASIAEGSDLMSDSLLITAMAFCFYSTNTFFWRRRSLRRKDDTDRYDDPYGPTVLGGVLLFSLAAIFTAGLVKLLSNDLVAAHFAK